MSFASSAPRWSEVYLSAAARAVSSCGDMLAATALLLVLQDRGHGGIAAAALLMAEAIPPVLLASVAGRVADRFDSRHILLVVGCAQVMACVFLAYATSMAAIVGLVALLAAGLAVTQPTLSALTPSMVGRENLAKAGGIGQTAGTIGMLAGPALGGLLVGAFGPHVPLLIDAATYLAIPFAGLALRTRRRGGTAATESVDAGAARADWTLWRDSLVRPVVVLFGAVIMAVGAINVVNVFFVRGDLHAKETTYGLVNAVWFVGMVIGSAVLSRRNLSDARLSRVMLALLTVTSLVVVASSSVPHVAWLMPLMVIGGIGNGGENVAAGVLIGRRAPDALRGRAFAAFGGVMNAAAALGYAAGGLALSLATPRMVMLGIGLAGLAVITPFAVPLLRAARHDEQAKLTMQASATPIPEPA